MIYPAAIRFTYLQCSFVLWRCLFCRHVYFMTLFTSVKWTSNRSQQPPLQSVWEKPFSLSFSLFFFVVFLPEFIPPGHSKLLCSPTVRLLCLSAAAHLFGFYGLCFSLGSVYAWLGPALLKWWRGGVQNVRGGDLLFVMMCLWLLFPFVISSQQPDGDKRGEFEQEWQVSVSPFCLFPPPPRNNTHEWLTLGTCCCIGRLVVWDVTQIGRLSEIKQKSSQRT